MHARAHKTSSSPSGRKHRDTSPVVLGGNQLRSGLQKLYWTALYICVLVVPLTMTGIREYGIAIFLACSLGMGVTWASRRILFPGSAQGSVPAFLIAILAIGLVLLQLQPLPSEVLAKLSPFVPKYLTAWGSTHSPVINSTGWQQITMTPEATRSGLVLLIAYAIFFLTLLQHLQSQADVDRLMKLIGISAVLMAGIGIGQTLFGNNRFLWLFEHPTRNADWPAKGTFHNQNHFAQFLALGLGPLVWWWYSMQSASDSDNSGRKKRHTSSGRRKRRRPPRTEMTKSSPAQTGFARIVAAGTAVVVLAAILSFSRGGIAAFLLAGLVVSAAVLKQRKTALRYFIPTIIFVVCGLAAFGTDGLTRRLDQLTNAVSLEDVDSARWTLWKADAQAISEFWPMGSGIGSHADVYPIWMANHFGVRFSHAESGYIQVLLETGLPGFTLLMSGILITLYWCIRGWNQSTGSRRVQVAALSASVLASIVHSVVDFVWYIPACMILALAVVACVCRCSQLFSASPVANAGTRIHHLSFVLAGVLLLVALPTGQLFADSISRDLTSADSWKAYRTGIRASVEDVERGTTDTLNDRLDSLIQHLEECSAADPFHHDVHTALAPLYLQRFEHHLQSGDNQLTLRDIRDTIKSSGFTSEEEMQAWLKRVCGNDLQDLYRARYSARRGLQNRPLRGESYVILTETGFLDSCTEDYQRNLIHQAVRLRPNEPRVLYAAGLLAETAEETETVWKMWRHAANLDTHIAQLIVRRNIDLLSISELIQYISPTPDTFTIIYQEYRKAERLDDLPVIAAMFAEQHATRFSNGIEGSSRQLTQYAKLFLEANQTDLAVRCLRRAAQIQPRNPVIRKQLATALVQTDDLRAAHQELSWLNLSMPNDKHITQLLLAVEERMQSQGELPGFTESPPLIRASHAQRHVSEQLPKPTPTTRSTN